MIILNILSADEYEYSSKLAKPTALGKNITGASVLLNTEKGIFHRIRAIG